MSKYLLKTALLLLLSGSLFASGILTKNPVSTKAKHLVSQNEWKKEIHVYPNPSAGDFQLRHQFENGTPFSLQVYNVIGEMVFEQSIVSEGAAVDIPVSLKQPQGLYFVKVSLGEETVTRKMIIKR